MNSFTKETVTHWQKHKNLSVRQELNLIQLILLIHFLPVFNLVIASERLPVSSSPRGRAHISSSHRQFVSQQIPINSKCCSVGNILPALVCLAFGRQAPQTALELQLWSFLPELGSDAWFQINEYLVLLVLLGLCSCKT